MPCIGSTNLLLKKSYTEIFLFTDLFETPKCAFWNTLTHRWSTLGCQLVSSNRTHSSCACRRLATFALLAPSDGLGGSHYLRNGGATNDVLIGVLAAFFLVLLLLIIVVLACYCRHKKVRVLTIFGCLFYYRKTLL